MGNFGRVCLVLAIAAAAMASASSSQPPSATEPVAPAERGGFAKFTREDLAKSREITTLAPEAGTLISGYCPAAEPVTYEQAIVCSAVVHAAAAFELGRQGALAKAGSIDLIEVAEFLFDASLNIASVNADVWEQAIEDSVKDRVAHTFSQVLLIVQRVNVATGGGAALTAMGEELKTLTKNDGRPEAMDLTVAVHEMLNHALSPSGSLRSYVDTANRIKERFGQAKIRLSMAKDPTP